MKIKTRKISYQSSSDSDYDAPLVKLQSGHSADLFKYSEEKCNFCDRIFNNKYNMLVHNARHIIIPLINLELHKCSQCDHIAMSLESLKWHTMNLHSDCSDRNNYMSDILESFFKKEPVMILKKEPLLKDKKTVNGEKNKLNREENVPDILKSLVLKEPVTVLTKLTDADIIKERNNITNDQILQCMVKKQPITLLKKEIFKFDNENEIEKITILDSDEECDIIKTEVEFDCVSVDSDGENSKNPRIKDRIQFEDEEEDVEEDEEEDEDVELLKLDDILSDIATVKMGNNEISLKAQKNKNAIILGNKPYGRKHKYIPVIQSDGQMVTESWHYDDLKNPGLFKCKKCSKVFPNRYDEIVHESSHLAIKRRLPFLCRYCDWYVGLSPNALCRHQQRRHPEHVEDERAEPIKKCLKCGLNYIDKMRHRSNYHHNEDSEDESGDNTAQLSQPPNGTTRRPRIRELAEQIVGNERITWLISTVKVCEFCYQWFKERSNFKYQHVKYHSLVGQRLPCERCERPCFELRVVRMRIKKMMRKDIEAKKQKKSVSNTDRLKNFHNRLIKLKKMNKL